MPKRKNKSPRRKTRANDDTTSTPGQGAGRTFGQKFGGLAQYQGPPRMVEKKY